MKTVFVNINTAKQLTSITVQRKNTRHQRLDHQPFRSASDRGARAFGTPFKPATFAASAGDLLSSTIARIATRFFGVSRWSTGSPGAFFRRSGLRGRPGPRFLLTPVPAARIGMAGHIARVAPRLLASAPPCGGLRPVTNSHTASSRTGSSTCLFWVAARRHLR